MMTASAVQADLAAVGSHEDAAFLQRFFKTDTGQYGAGDVFIGVRVPQTRAVAKRFRDLPLGEIDILLDSGVHEHRLAGLIIVNGQFARASAKRTRNDELRERIAAFYLAAVRRGRVNNWDLVDASAEFVLGEYLYDRPRTLLFELAVSDTLWWRRVAALSSCAFIKHGDASTTLELAALLLERSRGSDAQGSRLDAARSRQTRRSRPAHSLSRRARRTDATHHAQLRE